jgi:hypothetical protein
MILGPPDIINCPICNTSYLKQSLISGNTFGGICFSDGQSLYPMLPEQPKITICDTCQHFFWVNDIESHENISDYEGNEDPPYIRWLYEEEFLRAISLGIYRNEKEEIYLRTHLWWILNNKFRVEDRMKPKNEQFPEKLYKENLNILLKLRQSEDSPDLLLQAEIHRELGNFDKALELLKEVKDEHHKDICRQITEKARQFNPFVFKLT